MHENMCVCEQGEHHFLLDFVLSSCMHRLPVHAQSFHARVCHSCLLVLALCVCVFLCALVWDAGDCTGVYSWSEHVCVYVCVHMHLFHIQDLTSLLEVCEYLRVCSHVPCSAAGHPPVHVSSSPHLS